MTQKRPHHPQATHPAERPASASPSGRFWPVVVLLTATVFLWTYWATILDLLKEYRLNEDYSVGGLVPIAALYLLWHDRKRLAECRVAPCWWGIVPIVIAQVMRLYGLLFLYQSAERYSLVLTIAGTVLLMAGWQVFKRIAWILVFMLLMVPLPGRIHNTISGPLQRLATMGAVFMLELSGITVAREGNVIVLNDTVPLAVAEACSGLRMLTAFVIVGATLAYLVNRPRWQKVVVVISSVPIAILCNLIRLFVTAELYLVASSETAEKFFHDFAGLTMMPLAILLLVGELALMNILVVPEKVPSVSGRAGRPQASKVEEGFGRSGSG
ncbi:MAG: exosortase/archaeosortase family protein [Phycisphaerae bacterium]|nr:exosortase/archaeosortase family protein [Phycisphaerae bacterium]